MTGDGLFDKLARYNANVLYWLTVFGQLLAIAFWVSLMFIILEGYLKLNSKKYRLITALNESEKVRSGRR